MTPIPQADLVALLLSLTTGPEAERLNPQRLEPEGKRALCALKRLRLLRPARFAPARNHFQRPAILAYALTDEGQAFLLAHRPVLPASS